MTEALRKKAHQCGPRSHQPGPGRFRRRPRHRAAAGRSGRFLMKPATIGLDEMTLDNIITVDLDGQKVGGTMPRHNEVFIHSEVLRARSDVQCVIHTHAPHAVAFSSLGKELVPVNNEAGYFYKSLPVFSETTDLIVTPGARQGGGALPRPARGADPAQSRHRHRRPQHRGGGLDRAQARARLPRAAHGRVGGRPEVRAPRARTCRRRTSAAIARISTPTCSTIWCARGAACTARPTIRAATSTTRRTAAAIRFEALVSRTRRSTK